MFNADNSAMKGIFGGRDPRAILISGFILMFSIVFIENYIILASLIAVCALMLTGWSGNQPLHFKRLLAANVFTLFIWLSFPFTVENGVALALIYTLRINACAFIFMLLIAPLGISALSNALIALKCPGKLVSLLVLTYRAIFLLRDRLATALTAMQLRRPENIGTLRLWRTYAALFATAISSAILRSERMQQAMMLRGFDGTLPATAELRWKTADTSLILSVVLIVTILCYIQLCLK
jgi:cobalt/nickel transport system permease protein